ncbi:AAA family ATPase [Endozoicomonas sp. 8E]|uniref:AAA family ATPase n=1 Tax=Endozoicomonas sp. 8E TaxID=3035692 RepID=UPI0029394C80|nr:AAA family ATPase [Endozoicomonas sp. 8E]WOG28902.1 AAA family ATPase [Endozoicomonas sp. 8E]
MDGQIGGEINKPVPAGSLPDDGLPAKKSGQDSDLPLNVKAVCSGLNYQLNLSSSRIMTSDRARTVSSTDSPRQKKPHAFDFRFVAIDDEVRQLLADQTRDKNRDVTLISHPDDLAQANLVSRLSIAGNGRHTLRSGKLFEGSQPLTLVIDIRKLSSEDLPKFNDLLDPDHPCLYDKVSQKKRPLGEHVSLLVLAAPEQLTSVGQCDDAPAAGAPGADAPGADFWRRINRPGNSWQFEAETGNDPSMDIDGAPPLLPEFPSAENAMDDNTILVIDCHLHANWRQLLLGGPGVDQQGRIQHIPGRLERLTSGQRVILKGADWQDLTFEQTIRQMLAQQCFESNGEVCPLPDNVQFYQMPVGKDELHTLFQSQSKEHAAENPIIINQGNITEWLSPIAITPEGYAIPNTCLLEQVRAGGVVTVTSPLTEALWFRLLGSLQTLRETTGLEARLQVAHSKQQPKALGLAEDDGRFLSSPHSKVTGHATFHTTTYQQHVQASHWINHQPQTPLVIQVNEQTGFTQLFDNIHIASEQKAHFRRSQSELQEALTAGKPVVFRGLESNPTLQQLLEPLVIGQPLLVNGQLQAYPQAHVTILWPESVKSASSVFNSMVTKGSRCPKIDLWDINALKHGLSRAELPEQTLHSLYEAFKTVPGGLCNALPEITEGLLNNLILAARRAQQSDHSSQLLPCHWRKAINSVITHGTRQHPSVRDFMKVACLQLLPDEDQAASVDPDQLAAIINSDPRLDRNFVKRNLWQLARAFNPAVFIGTELQLSYESPFPEWGKKEVMDRLCAMILAHAPENQRDAIAYQLAVDPAATKPWQSLVIEPTRQIKRLQDALACSWHLPLHSGQTRSDAIHGLATDCFYMARTASSEAEGIERIEHRLSESLKWTGSADEPLSALARDLYHGVINQKDRESRRLSRLHDRLTDSPVIFLEGETGTGKSYFSAKMAKASGQAAVISLGPSDSEQTLMKRWQWQQHADGDRSMAQQNRALMEWANTKPDKDGGNVGANYITLVLDEANLAEAGLLASLNGLWEPEPCIYVNGHPVKVSEKHRVILTGNPDHYAGRQMDPALKEKLPKAYYPRLDQAFLRDRVVEPALLSHLQRHQINDSAYSVTKSVMTLWQFYQELLPEHEFTPRDLTDICSWVGWYLDRALSRGDSASCKQVSSLIQQSFRDVLGPEISETHQDALSALEIWFAARYELDNTLRDKVHNHTLPDIQRDFEAFTKEFQPEFDTSGSAVIELVQHLGQDLSRCQQAYHHDRKHGGRQATLIEGPAGRGKDATLNLLIESVRQQAIQRGESMPEVFLLNACDCSWDKVCEKIQKAKIDGGIVVISEMNLIDSQHLEGELNDILAGDAHPGFHLFATINPPEYSGRKPLSPAMKGRFRHLPIRQYSPSELQAIAGKVLPENEQGKIVAKRLTEKHCRLRACLQGKDLPLQPTSRDLQNIAMAVKRGGDFSEKALHQCLNQHYRLYLMAANLSLEELPQSSTLAMGKGALASELSHWLYQKVPNIDRPWLIRLSDRNSIDEKGHEILVEARLDKKQARTEIIKRVAQARWQASGFSVAPDQYNDILTRALYRYWQHRWFHREFGLTGEDANSLFPLTKEEKQTLKIPSSQPFLREADKLIGAWKAHAVQWWPAFWHQISHLPNHWLGDYMDEKLAAGTGNTPDKHRLNAHSKQGKALDRRTNYECLKVPLLYDLPVFKTQRPTSRMYRWEARDICVTAKGDIILTNLNDPRIQGFVTLMPARLPGPDQEVILTSNQTLASFKWTSKKGQFVLPSLTPEDHIVALRIEPDLPFKLLRHRYTGLHTLIIPEANTEQTIQFTYVVEPKKPDDSVSAEKALPEQSVRFDTHCSEGIKTVLDELFSPVKEHPAKLPMCLQTIKNARQIQQQIKAITEYCRQFSGKTEPKPEENFFRFLVTQQQGSCRHRAPVFVAFCRYFGIPSRQIHSLSHHFAEYSLDRGQTWESVDLGGGAGQVREIKSEFQPTRQLSSFCTETQRFKDLLKGADSAQQEALAQAIDKNLEEQNEALETGSVFANSIMITSEMVRELWKRKDLTGFSTGVSILLDKKALNFYEQALVGAVTKKDSAMKYKPMVEAVEKILSDSDGEQVTEQLKLLHSKVIVQAEQRPQQWLSSMVDILNGSDLTRPSVIQFALVALESGWLDPLPEYDQDINGVLEQHELLLRLEGVDELKVKATRRLKNLYKQLFSREKNSQVWQLAYKGFQTENDACLVTHCHGGFSPSLEELIVRKALQDAWTDKPEGIPNIERLLVHHPAFVRLNSGRTLHRPVIILGQPCWDSEAMIEKTKALFQRKVESSPELKQSLEKVKQYRKKNKEYLEALEDLDNWYRDHSSHEQSMLPDQQCQTRKEQYEKREIDIKSHYKTLLDSIRPQLREEQVLDYLKIKCEQAIRQAFSHYLYGLTHSKGGSLTYCWAEASTNDYRHRTKCYGTHDPSSPEELYAMMHLISSEKFPSSARDAYLKQALNISNALVLKSDDLTKINEEFLNNVNLNSIYESLDT